MTKRNCAIVVKSTVAAPGEVFEKLESAVRMGCTGFLSGLEYGAGLTAAEAVLRHIIGCRIADPNQFFPPKKTHFNPELEQAKKVSEKNGYDEVAQPWKTVRDAISDDGMCCQVRSWQRKLYAECCHRVYYPLDPGSIRQGHWVSGARCS